MEACTILHSTAGFAQGSWGPWHPLGDQTVPFPDPASARRWPDVDLMLAQRRRRWPSIGTTSAQRLAWAGGEDGRQKKLTARSGSGYHLIEHAFLWQIGFGQRSFAHHPDNARPNQRLLDYMPRSAPAGKFTPTLGIMWIILLFSRFSRSPRRRFELDGEATLITPVTTDWRHRRGGGVMFHFNPLSADHDNKRVFFFYYHIELITFFAGRIWIFLLLIWRIWIVFTHLKLWTTPARHSLKWVNIRIRSLQLVA